MPIWMELLVLLLVAYAVGRRQAVRDKGLHDEVLPPEPVADTPPAVIGE